MMKYGKIRVFYTYDSNSNSFFENENDYGGDIDESDWPLMDELIKNRLKEMFIDFEYTEYTSDSRAKIKFNNDIDISYFMLLATAGIEI